MKDFDPLGLKAVGETGEKLTEATIDGVSGFLEAVCKPCCVEFGLMLKDKIREWRLCNIARVIEKSKYKLSYDGDELNLRANPRVGLSILEECSIVDNEELQDLWAGLFASSCTPDGKDDSNMNFVDLIKRMSSVEARILRYGCEQCQKEIYPNRLIVASEITVSFEKLVTIAGTSDIYRLDSELDHMRSIMLLNHSNFFQGGGGFIVNDKNLGANITPSPLGLNLYYKTHAVNLTPEEFWRGSLVKKES